MATSTNLNITHWTAAQSQPEVTVNTALNILDGLAAVFTHNMASGADYTLATTGTEPFEWQHLVIRVTDTNSPKELPGASSPEGAAIIVPAYPRAYFFVNATDVPLTLKKSGGTGIAVAANKWALLAYTTADADVIRITPDA